MPPTPHQEQGKGRQEDSRVPGWDTQWPGDRWGIGNSPMQRATWLSQPTANPAPPQSGLGCQVSWGAERAREADQVSGVTGKVASSAPLGEQEQMAPEKRVDGASGQRHMSAYPYPKSLETRCPPSAGLADPRRVL